MAITGFYIVLLGFTYMGPYWTLLGFPRCYQVLLDITEVLPTFTGSSWVLVRLTEHYLACLGLLEITDFY